LRLRFLAGIEDVPEGSRAMFFTFAFPAGEAPDETEAQHRWRSLSEYGFVLQRTRRGTLHFHGIAHIPWM
jgi:hypothetical protein